MPFAGLFAANARPVAGWPTRANRWANLSPRQGLMCFGNRDPGWRHCAPCPYMFYFMHDITVYPAVPGRLSGWVQRRSFTKASVARRSERAPLNVARFVIPNVDTDGRFGWALFSTYAFLLMQDIESTAPAHGAVVARASSSSPRTMFNTSPKPSVNRTRRCSKLEPLQERWSRPIARIVRLS